MLEFRQSFICSCLTGGKRSCAYRFDADVIPPDLYEGRKYAGRHLCNIIRSVRVGELMRVWLHDCCWLVSGGSGEGVSYFSGGLF
jgi:hypothetical protein